MARKTSKTNHVLNLLAGSGESEEDIVERKEKSEVSKASESSNVNVQVVGSSKEDEAIVNTVNQLLEQELEEEFQKEPEGAPKKELEGGEFELLRPDEFIQDVEEFVPPQFGESLREPEELAEVEKDGAEPLEEYMSEELRGTDGTGPEISGAEMETTEEDVRDEAINLGAEVGQQLLDPKEIITVGLEPNFEFINVMEKLVEEKVLFYMKQFGNCLCSRCVADVIALTLTNLPPRYEVVEKKAAAPLMNFYSQHYMGQITVEITKACTTVRERPHHNRE